MTLVVFLVDLLRIVRAVTALLPLAFVAAYTWTTPGWRRTPEGKHLVRSHLIFGVILVLAVLTSFGLLTGLGLLGRTLLGLAVYLLLAAVFTAQIALFVMRRRERLRKLPERGRR